MLGQEFQRELPRDELVPSLQREVDGLRVEPTELVDDSPREGVVEREVARREEHVQDLGDPEEPDPGRHLVQILLERVDHLCELRRVQVSSLL